MNKADSEVGAYYLLAYSYSVPYKAERTESDSILVMIKNIIIMITIIIVIISVCFLGFI